MVWDWDLSSCPQSWATSWATIIDVIIFAYYYLLNIIIVLVLPVQCSVKNELQVFPQAGQGQQLAIIDVNISAYYCHSTIISTEGALRLPMIMIKGGSQKIKMEI